MKIGLLSFEVNTRSNTSGRGNEVIISDVLRSNHDLNLLVCAGWSVADVSALEQHVLPATVKHNAVVVMEIGRPIQSKYGLTHILYLVHKGQMESRGRQMFATSRESSRKKVVEWLGILESDRRFIVDGKSALWIECGEINALRHCRADNKATFRFRDDKILAPKFDHLLDGSDIIVNPIHDIMGRPSILKSKWRFLSQRNRIYCGTANWNLAKKQKQTSPTLQIVYKNGQKEQPIRRDDRERYVFRVYSV